MEEEAERAGMVRGVSERAGGKRGRGEGVKQQSLELRANYCNCNLDSKHRESAVTGSRVQRARACSKQTKKRCVCVSTSLHLLIVQ